VEVAHWGGVGRDPGIEGGEGQRYEKGKKIGILGPRRPSGGFEGEKIIVVEKGRGQTYQRGLNRLLIEGEAIEG